MAQSIKSGVALFQRRLGVQIALRNEILEICESSYTGHHQFRVQQSHAWLLAVSFLSCVAQDSHQLGCRVMSLGNKGVPVEAVWSSVRGTAIRVVKEAQVSVKAKGREEVQQACQVEDSAAGSVHH